MDNSYNPYSNWHSDANHPDWCVKNGWAGELSYPNTTNFQHHMSLYGQMIKWVLEYVDNPHDNVLWDKKGDCIYLIFRKKEDLIMFKLKFG